VFHDDVDIAAREPTERPTLDNEDVSYTSIYRRKKVVIDSVSNSFQTIIDSIVRKTFS
jgi:hypothetical protein